MFRARAVRRHPVWYRGNAVECPCCGGTFRRMQSHRGRPNARCPACGSAERHRVLWLYLRDVERVESRQLRVLHFAPEPGISRPLSGLANLDYVTGDLRPGAAMEVMDITAIPRADESFDLVLVSHVLEHVPDDGAAMRELFRVLAPGGRALLQHPVDYDRDTYEDWTISSAEERLRAFHQEDHVRIYGQDLRDRLEAVGFRVEVERYREGLGAEVRRRHALDEGNEAARADDIYVCSR